MLRSKALPERTHIINAFAMIDDELQCHFERRPRIASGTTAVGALVAPNGAGRFQVQLCNLGDSRALVMHPGDAMNLPAKVLLTTRDHKPDVAQERARIEAADL